MPNARGKEVDTTFLSLEAAADKGFLHRDYIAHCFRWSHVAKYMRQQKRHATHHLLDVGCGRQLPLAKMLFSSRLTHTSGSYTGVDYGPVAWPDSISRGTSKWNMELHPKTDFVKWAKTQLEHGKAYDTIVCFEMLEHVEPFHSYQTLKAIRACLAEDGVAFISTLCYDPKTGAADNHVNEMSYAALKALIRVSGFSIEAVWGTFASQKDYKKLLKPAYAELFEELTEYFDSEIVANMFAPLFPERARNCLWKLTSGDIAEVYLKGFDDPSHSNSPLWSSHLTRIAADVRKENRR